MLKKGKITIKDIANLLNVSISTVSRALKNHPDISEATRFQVNKIAKEYGYIPNSLALNLKNNRNNIIGVCVPKIAYDFFAAAIEGIEEIAEKFDYHVFITQSDELEGKEKRNIHAFIKERVAGVILSMAKETKDISHFKELQENDVPMVFFDRICTEMNTLRVVADDYNGALSAVDHLINTGCKKISIFHSPMHLEISKNRVNGYKDALSKHKIAINEQFIIPCDSRDGAIQETIKIMSLPNPPDAFFAVNDRTASGILFAIKKMGYKVPEEISICGFSNGVISAVTDPPLTTVEQHGKEIGMNAMKLLKDKLTNETDLEIHKKIIKTNLIIRETTRPI